MRFLLDTHVWLWLTSEPERLLADTLVQLSRAESELYLSVASAWEIGIKFAMGELDLQQPPELFIPACLVAPGVIPLRFLGVQAPAWQGALTRRIGLIRRGSATPPGGMTGRPKT